MHRPTLCITCCQTMNTVSIPLNLFIYMTMHVVMQPKQVCFQMHPAWLQYNSKISLAQTTGKFKFNSLATVVIRMPTEQSSKASEASVLAGVICSHIAHWNQNLNILHCILLQAGAAVQPLSSALPVKMSLKFFHNLNFYTGSPKDCVEILD